MEIPLTVMEFELKNVRNARTCSIPVPAAVVGVVVLLVYVDGHLVVVVHGVDVVRHVDHVVLTVNTTSTFSQSGVHRRFT